MGACAGASVRTRRNLVWQTCLYFGRNRPVRAFWSCRPRGRDNPDQGAMVRCCGACALKRSLYVWQ
jgi:hypothetical protein